MQLYEVSYVITLCGTLTYQHNFLKKSVEAPPERSSSVVVFVYILGGGAQVQSCMHFENNVRCCSRSVCAVLRS